jgi:hypothetical protein
VPTVVGVQGEAELVDAERGSDFDPGLPEKSDRVVVIAISALRSRGSKPADRRAGQGEKRRLSLSEGAVDKGELPAVFDDPTAAQPTDHTNAHHLQQIGELAR